LQDNSCPENQGPSHEEPPPRAIERRVRSRSSTDCCRHSTAVVPTIFSPCPLKAPANYFAVRVNAVVVKAQAGRLLRPSGSSSGVWDNAILTKDRTDSSTLILPTGSLSRRPADAQAPRLLSGGHVTAEDAFFDVWLPLKRLRRSRRANVRRWRVTRCMVGLGSSATLLGNARITVSGDKTTTRKTSTGMPERSSDTARGPFPEIDRRGASSTPAPHVGHPQPTQGPRRNKHSVGRNNSPVPRAQVSL
jgi:hypothetical protein